MPKDPTTQYQIFNDRFVLTLDFGAKPSYHDIGKICCLIEEEFHLQKHNLKTIWSDTFVIDTKKEKVDLVFVNCYREMIR